MAHGGKDGVDVKSISMRLQNLLQIPPIEGGEEKKESQSTKHNDSGRRSPLGTREKRNEVGKSPGYGNANVLIRTPHTNLAGGKENSFSGYMFTGPAGHQNSTPPLRGFAPPAPNLSQQALNELIPVRSRRLTEINSFAVSDSSIRPQTDITPIKSSESSIGRKDTDRMSGPILQLCEKPECPEDIRQNIQLFTEASFACEESRNSRVQYFFALDPRVKSILGSHFVETLNRKSVKFPRAKFYCQVCNYHLDSVYSALNHITQDRHFIQEKSRKLDYTLEHIMPPSVQHVNALTDKVYHVLEQIGLSKYERFQRIRTFSQIQELIENSEVGKECTVSLFGSSLSGLGLLNSDININVSFGNDAYVAEGSNESPSSPKVTAQSLGNDSALLIEKVLKILQRSKDLTDIEESYSTKKPIITFRHLNMSALYVMQFNNTSAFLLNRLIFEYELLDPRVRPLVTAFRYFARLCEIDVQDNGLLPAHCYTIMVIHYLQSCGVLPILHAIPKVDQSRPFASAAEAQKANWKSVNMNEVGQLWIGLLKYYALDFDYKNQVVTISRVEGLKRTDKFWNRRLSIEDPIVLQSNVARSAANNKVCDFIIDRIRTAYFYFAVPRTANGALYDGITDEATVNIKNVFNRLIRYKTTDRQSRYGVVRVLEMVDSELQSDEDLSIKIRPPITTTIQVKMSKTYSHNGRPLNFVLSKHTELLHSFLEKHEHHYEFERQNFMDGVNTLKICKSCGVEGHSRKNCPEETVPPLRAVTFPSELTLHNMLTAIFSNYESEGLRPQDEDLRIRIANEIGNLVCRFYPDVDLMLFGSSRSGFGLRNSDVDICMRFKGLVVPANESALQRIDVNDVLMNVVSALKSSGRMTDILPITSAKVPIVKFRHKEFKLEGDISLYNVLAIHNTNLLRAYSNLDARVKILGFFLKKLMKICDISDASKGSLSSYGYILMVIHYLQQCKQPVLPVLQELAPIGSPVGASLPVRVIDNCNTYFFDDLSRISEVWDGYGRNRESVERLWLGLLVYYTEEFNFEENVITISQTQPLSRKEKSWHTDALAIEDPFEKSHNLGAGLSRRMSVHILTTIQGFRELFHSSIDHLYPTEAYDFYMTATKAQRGNPPIDRQCRLCLRIGHIARNCTYVGKNDEDANDEDEISSSIDEGRVASKSEVTEPTEVYQQRHFVSPRTQSDAPHVVGKNIYQPVISRVNPSGLVHNLSIAAQTYINPEYGRVCPDYYMAQPGHLSTSGMSMRPIMAGQVNEFTDMSIFSDNMFLWNFDLFARSEEGQHLSQLIRKSDGVSFSDYLLEKAKEMKSTADSAIPNESPDDQRAEGDTGKHMPIQNNQHSSQYIVNNHAPKVLFSHNGQVIPLSHGNVSYSFIKTSPRTVTNLVTEQFQTNPSRSHPEFSVRQEVPPPPGFAPLRGHRENKGSEPVPSTNSAPTRDQTERISNSVSQIQAPNVSDAVLNNRHNFNGMMSNGNRHPNATIINSYQSGQASQPPPSNYMEFFGSSYGSNQLPSRDQLQVAHLYQNANHDPHNMIKPQMYSDPRHGMVVSGGFVSQAHQGPVVSAQQMQHGQHHIPQQIQSNSGPVHSSYAQQGYHVGYDQQFGMNEHSLSLRVQGQTQQTTPQKPHPPGFAPSNRYDRRE